MIFWTMQRIEMWEEAKLLGFLKGKEDYSMYPKEYKWMMSQMKKRLSNYAGEFPIWLWNTKPDMRTTGHFPGGTECVRLKIKLHKEDVLMSDFDRWHSVLNDSFDSDNQEEDIDFYKGLLDITKEESWERIFDLDRKVDADWTGAREHLQGVTGRISLNNVIGIEAFVTRRSKFD